MKIILFSFMVLIVLSWQKTEGQYQDTGTRGKYFPKKVYADKSLPTWEQAQDQLPVPVLTANPEYLELYWKSWQLAFQHLKKPPPGSPFVSNYLDEAFSPSIFQWDTIFMLMYARYAFHLFPAIESLDNFYCRQYQNGYICREIWEATGEDYVYEGREHTVNPPLFAWAEIEWSRLSGDRSRFPAVLEPLEKYAAWLEQYRKKENTTHGLYWQTGLGSGMDNTPRQGSGWTDMSSQMYMFYEQLAYLCQELKLPDKAGHYSQKAKEIGQRINQFMWNEEDGLYYDLDDDGSQQKCKTVACFWPLLAGLANEAKAEKMLHQLKDPKTFWRPVPFPSLAADERMYKADGQYWQGGVWAPTNVMIIKGLDKFNTGYASSFAFREFAVLASESYLDGMVKVFKTTGTIWENYSPESFSRGVWSRPDFVGWSGCGPIMLLIENILGFQPDALHNKLYWDLHRIDRHGIRQLRFGEIVTDLICQERESILSPAKIQVSSNQPYQLVFIQQDSVKVIEIQQGDQELLIE